jgi:hypothetical protein
VIGLLASGEDPSVHVVKLVLAGLVALGLLTVAVYALAAPTAEAYRYLRRRRHRAVRRR